MVVADRFMVFDGAVEGFDGEFEFSWEDGGMGGVGDGVDVLEGFEGEVESVEGHGLRSLSLVSMVSMISGWAHWLNWWISVGVNPCQWRVGRA